ncbi:H-2 class I histocompatibility antigen, K-Q alpha chain-like [Stigmatopora nigra]
MLILFVLAVHIQSVQSGFHALQYIDIVSYQIPKIPEYLSVAYVDGVQITHYDSKSGKSSPKQDWVNKITTQDPDYWRRATDMCSDNRWVAKVNLEIANERFNRSGGVHTIQRMSGCQWNDETGEVVGWEHYAYDGEDFISLDLKEWRWLAFKPQALVTKHKLEQFDLGHKKYYYTEICPYYLKAHVSNGKAFLARTVLPRLSLLKKTSWSPVTCHATGFYPRDAVMFWQKDGRQIFEDVEREETLPNHDGTFQVAAHLKAVDPSARYECVFQLFGVPDDIVVPLDDSVLLSNERIEGEPHASIRPSSSETHKAEERKKIPTVTIVLTGVVLAFVIVGAIVLILAIVYQFIKDVIRTMLDDESLQPTSVPELSLDRLQHPLQPS